jgi:hypothetical protein
MSKVLVSRLQWLLLAVSFGAGCAARFDTLPRIFENGAASSQTDDVRLMGALVDGVSRPCECPAVAAILVAIQNGSDRLLSVRYENFVLRWVAGNALRPLPAFNLEDANGVGMPVSYAYPWSGFWLAAPLGQYYRGFWGGATNLSRDAAYYTTQHAALVRMTAAVPVRDLVRVALPDGHIAGLLYFVRPAAEHRATLSATLTNPDATGRGLVLDIAIEIGKAETASP